ncbi:hypothetical protein Aperf_G00000124202 [Anoplocephala perfoliata]
MSAVTSDTYMDDSSIYFVDFNQDYTSLCVGTRSGYSLLSTENDQIVETYAVDGDPMCLVGRLFTSNLVTLVSLADPRRLLIYHSRRDSLICDYRYSNTILAVKMNRQRLIVCVENEIFIHNIRDMELLHRIEDTPSNRNGVIAFSSHPEKCLLAYPGSNRTGTVYIFDATKFTNVTSIAAHDSPLAELAFNSSSTLLATASERGTVVRVFTIPDGEKVMEFRRGLARCVSVCSLTFSLDDHFLVCASNTETIHVFKLRKPESASPGSQDEAGVSNGPDANSPVAEDPALAGTWTSSIMSWVGGALKTGASYLPNPVAEVFTQDRSFAFARIPLSSRTASQGAINTLPHNESDHPAAEGPGYGFKKTAAIISSGDQYRLLVAGLDGYVYTFTFDPIHGGEATLVNAQGILSSNNNGVVPPAHQSVQGSSAATASSSRRSFADVASSKSDPPTVQPSQNKNSSDEPQRLQS